MALTLTSTNSVFAITVPQVFGSIPQVMQNFAADDMFETENVAPSEVIIGTDAQVAAGRLPYLVTLKFILQAISPSIYTTMNTWLGAMNQPGGDTYACNATIILPGVQTVYTFSNGYLTGAIIMPGSKKILQQVPYEIKFQSCVPSPYLP